MNILICDDIRDEALKLQNAVKEADLEANVMYFFKPQDVLKYIKTNVKIDVCFLDIIMPEMNGIELARKMRAEGFGGKIVFLTTSKDYGVESYQVKAYFYLLKPINTKDVVRLLNEIKNTSPIEDNAGIKIETRNLTRFVYFYEISFVEVINKNVYFRLLDGSEIVIFASLGDILPQLTSDGRFAQCHRSYVVNIDAVTQIRGKEIILRCGRKVPISRSYKEFSDQYYMRVMEKDMQ
ncbi:MAG: LytTR family DNA-binding domain-containing protein [Treponema sp.]|nr:LytTR family DNA-binding domain-containing protein [Treponema sp.]MCL2251153.1 LytTR family DNA-binding domain-containing protein [Treponema sp.]